MKHECATCQFMRATPMAGQTGGGDPILEPHCMRNAPQPVLVSTQDLRKNSPWAVWPRVSYRDWCGEYQQVEATE